MFKVLVYWRWDKGKQSADCFWCVPWPEGIDIPNEVRVMNATHMLEHGRHRNPPFDEADALRHFGYPEAAQMVTESPWVGLRARFNQMEQEIFNSDVPVTREQIESIKFNRRKT